MPARHLLYQAALHVLNLGALAPVLDAWWPGAGRWERIYGRFQTGDRPWAVLAYADPDRRDAVRVELSDAPCEPPDGDVVGPRLGGVRLVRAEHDPALPGLGSVVDRLHDARLVRYRPGMRCTLAGRTDQGHRFVKVSPDARALHRDAVDLWDAAGRGLLPFLVAEPVEWDAQADAFWQSTVPGRPVVAELLGPDGERLATRMGAALAGLATSGVRPRGTLSVQDQAERTGRVGAGVVAMVPELADRVDRVLAGLGAWQDRLAPRPLLPVHGAPHAHQWLRDGDRLGLIDFDRYALGDPELDAVTLLAELDSERGRMMPVERYRAALESGYRTGGVELDHDRMDFYLAHKRMARVRRLAWALRPDGHTRAGQHLELVEADLRRAFGGRVSWSG